MGFSHANGGWIAAAALFVIMVLLVPYLIGRLNFQRRVAMPVSNFDDLLYSLWSEPRSTLFRLLVSLVGSLCKAYKACEKWLGRFLARKLRPNHGYSGLSLLPLHRMASRPYQCSPTSALGDLPSFLNLPFDIRIIVYQQFLQLLPRAKWSITSTMKADPSFLEAMAFSRTCRLVREELGPMLFSNLICETDAKYPFYRNLPTCLAGQICNLSLHFRPSTDLELFHHHLVQQLLHMQNLCRLAITVAGSMLVGLHHEFEHILRRCKTAHPSLQSMTITTRVTLATPTDDLVLSQVMRRLSAALLPVFGTQLTARAAIWTRDLGKGIFRPATGWYCRISSIYDPEWEDLPVEVD